jgi:hypothetical protein
MAPRGGPWPIWDFGRFRDKDRLSALCELEDWVSHTLTDRYQLGGHLPECWIEHPSLVDVLVQLHEWEVEARQPDEVFRWLEAARAAARSWAGACTHHLTMRATQPAVAAG